MSVQVLSRHRKTRPPTRSLRLASAAPRVLTESAAAPVTVTALSWSEPESARSARDRSTAAAPAWSCGAGAADGARSNIRSEEHTSELQSHHDLVCRLLLEKKKAK